MYMCFHSFMCDIVCVFNHLCVTHVYSSVFKNFFLENTKKKILLMGTVLCSAVRGLLDWVEVDQGFHQASFFRLIRVLSVLSSHTLLSCSPLVPSWTS